MDMTRTQKKMIVMVCWSFFASACTPVGPDFSTPTPDIPSQWGEKLVLGLSVNDDQSNNINPTRDWWEEFEDPMLSRLILRAQKDNHDIKIAYSRIGIARARLGIASSERFPDLNAQGSAKRRRLSEGVYDDFPGQQRIDNLSDLGIDASWELDFWGRVRRSIESAGASYQTSIENYGHALVLLYAEVARYYVLVRTLQERLRFAQQNVQVQRDTLKLVTALKEAGLVPELDIHQAELNLAITESQLPLLLSYYVDATNRLSVLLGEKPGSLRHELNQHSVPIPQPPPKIVIDLPADWVRQRPDIRRAEYKLAAQTARVGMATSALYPHFFIDGQFSFATASGDLINQDNSSWSVGPFFSWNLFDGGRVRNQIEIEERLTKEALLHYEKTVLEGIEDVENAISSFTKERFRQASLYRSVIAAEKSARQVKSLYRNGLTNFQNVLDMERSLFNQQDSLAESSGRVTLNLIQVYRAFGGGWNN